MNNTITSPANPGAQFQRLDERERPGIEFELDGQRCQALLGDTVLTAILTQRSAIRSTEFSGQKRAGFCLMGACQDCWIRLASGEPIRACTTLLEDGMQLITYWPEDARHA